MTTLLGAASKQMAEGVVAAVGEVVRDQRTLGDVLEWGRGQTPPQDVTDIVTQDEYTHDVVVRWDARHFLVYDTT